MKGILKYCHLPENLEILFMLVLGILLQMTDGSPFSMKERWMLVWNTELPKEYFGLVVQKFLKIILSAIVVVRCSTTYAYVVSAMLVIFSLSKKVAPKLMLPWLLVAAVKSVCMTFIEALTGVYVCSAFGEIRKACIEFFISKALEIIFATYLWGSVLNIYQEMERKAENEINLQTKDQTFQKLEFGRQRARSLLDESTLYKTACLNNFEFKDVPQIILQMLRRGNEMSQDSLLGSGMMLASVSNLGSFDNLKTSQSLGELGYMDLRTIQVIGLEENENLSYRDKALRFLKLTWSDVERIKLSRTVVENDIYAVDEKTWKRVMASGTHINKPKQARTEVFIHEIPQPDLGEENIAKTKNRLKFDFKFGFSFSNLFNEKQTDYQSDQDEDESLIFSQDEDEEREDEMPTEIFMSNIKGDNINRCYLNLGLKQTKGTEYVELYKQDFMSVIGPEVFDKAPNLPKVISLTKNPRDLELRTSVSLPAFQEAKQASLRKISFSKNSKEKVYYTSSSDLYLSGSEHPNDEGSVAFTEPLFGEKIKKSGILSATEDEKLADSSLNFKIKLESLINGGHLRFAPSSGFLPHNSVSQQRIRMSYNSKERRSITKDERKGFENLRVYEVYESAHLQIVTEKTKIGKNEEKKQKKEETEACLPMGDIGYFMAILTPGRNEPHKSEDGTRKLSKNEELKFEKVDVVSDDDSSVKARGKSPVLSLKVSRRYIVNTEEPKSKSCLKKRKIIIKRIGRRKIKTPPRRLSKDSHCSAKNLSRSSDHAKAILDSNDAKNHPEFEISISSETSSSSLSNEKELLNANENQIYFLLELLQKPLLEVLVTYYGLKKKVNMQRKDNNCPQKFLDNFYGENESGTSQKKNWKSDVLKTVETFKESPLLNFTSLLNVIKKKSVMKKLLKYEYFYWKRKKKNSLTTGQGAFPLWSNPKDEELYATSNIKSMYIDVSRISDDSINSKVEIDIGLNLQNDSKMSANGAPPTTSQHEESKLSENSPEIIHIDFISYKISKANTTVAEDSQSNNNSTRNHSDLRIINTGDIREVEIEQKFDLETETKSEVLSNGGENKSICSQESEEPISLYYSKAANLASPLLDMKRFIYPDHIHYSYKHVKKKGFDVNINSGFPLLVRESLAMSSPVKMENETAAANSEFAIKKRPMDLSFAEDNAFAEWQNNDQNDVDSVSSETMQTQMEDSRSSNKKESKPAEFKKSKKMNKFNRSKKSNDRSENCPPKKKETNNSETKSNERNLSDNYYFYSSRDYALVEKLLRMHMRLNSDEYNESKKFESERKPVQISSAQLHSNKGRKNSTYNPAIFLQENIKTKNEKKKVETPEKRTKDMFARLESEALFQNKNVQKSVGSTWNA